MLPRLLTAALCLLPLQAFADGPWSFEFEFGRLLPSSDRLLSEACTKVVPVDYVAWYAIDPRPGFEISCGNNQPVYLHWLGRRIGRPLPNLEIEIGWRHFSSVADSQEISFDALSVRGRFSWGKR